MSRIQYISLISLILAGLWLAACQPVVERIEIPVTRLVDLPVTRVTDPELIEVTRVVEAVITVEVPVEIPVEVLVEVTPEAGPVVALGSLGTAERPFRLLFPSSGNDRILANGGQILADTLAEETGWVYEVEVLADVATVIAALCQAPDQTITFLSPVDYMTAYEQCGAQATNTAVRLDSPWRIGQFVVAADSGIDSLSDLDGAVWAVPSLNSLEGYLFPEQMLTAVGVTPAEIIEAGSDNNAMLAVYNGEAEVGTAFFRVPYLPVGEGAWVYGRDDPEIWRRLGLAPARSPLGYILVGGGPEQGGYRIRDARAGIFDTTPDIFAATRILTLTVPIPNEAVAFGGQMPIAFAWQIANALVDFAAADICQQSICSPQLYGWQGLVLSSHEAYAVAFDELEIED